ncbi:MAG TPA: hypothetical protein VIH03_08200 [Nitrososphaerales archaeon]
MADELDSKEIVSFKELLLSNVYTQEALINLLERKGILTKKEVLEEIKQLQSSPRKEND